MEKEALLDLVLDDADFQRVQQMLHARVGIRLNDSKRQLVFNRLSKRIRELKLPCFAAYLDRVKEQKSEEEAFLNALTTNLTSFFRESHHFPALAAQIKALPEKAPIRIWCSAASTGEEPYSIAMTLVETLGETMAAKRVRITATDLDTQVLEHGRRGIYRMDQVAQIPHERLQRFFLRGQGSKSGQVRIKPELQRLITFSQVNLLDSHWPIKPHQDAIFCRNVMIYFDKITQLHILERFHPLLAPHGVLFAGHSETFGHASHLFRTCGRNIFIPVIQKEKTP